MHGFMKKSGKNKRIKIIRVTTHPRTLYAFCRGFLAELSEDYEVIAVSSPGEKLDDLSQSEKVRCIPVRMERPISLLKDLVSLFNLIKVFKSERPQMVHSMTPKAGLLSMIAARITGVPVRIHTFTGLVFPTSTGFKRKLLMLTDRITCACATHIIPEGMGVKHDLESYGITCKPMQILGYGNVRGINLQYYDRTEGVLNDAAKIRQTLGIGQDCFVFIFVGRLVGDKGINELVAAFDKLCSQVSNLYLLLVGHDEVQLDPLAENTLRTIAGNPCIHAVGEQQDVRPWYAASDALVFPSYREGFPNVVIEAGAMGLPSIVTDINGSREIIRQNVNGVIVPSHDADALFQTMSEFINHPEKMKEMGKKARPLVASRYEQTFVRRCLKDFYRSVLNGLSNEYTK